MDKVERPRSLSGPWRKDVIVATKSRKLPDFATLSFLFYYAFLKCSLTCKSNTIMQKIDFDKAFSRIKPETMVFVISSGKRPNGMIAGWFTKCSSDPHMLAVALWEKGYTHKLIRKSKEFVIAIPNKNMEKHLLFFGTTHGNKIDKFAKSGISTEKAKYVKSPLLKDATMNFECKLEKEIKTGNHFLFIGRVVAAYVNKDKKNLFYMGKKKGKYSFREF